MVQSYKAILGEKEKGKDRVGLKEIKRFLDETQIDARYLFCQIDSFDKADMKNPDYEKDIDLTEIAEGQKRVERAIVNKLPEPMINDSEYEALGKAEIRELVRLLKPWPSNYITYVLGYAEGKVKEWKSAKESAGA